jgi:PAS domain S-box-containing protein
MHGYFYGFFSFDDCHRERYFTGEEIEILRSVGLMIASALNRNDQSMQLKAAHERTQVILDAMPLATQLWDTDINLIDCNDENIRLFGVNDKKELIENFFKFQPEYLDDGRPSVDVAYQYLKQTLDEGKLVVEWSHITKDGRPFPAEVTLARVCFGGKTYIASYSRDLSEIKNMIKEIKQRDKLLFSVIANYSGIIWCVNSDDVITLLNGRYLVELGLESKFFEGKKLDEAFSDEKFSLIKEIVPKTFADGSQDISADVEGKTYRIRTTPIYEDGNVKSVMGSFDDITERTRLQIELKEALKTAQAASDAKTSFLARMSHEIRTPLNAVIGLSQLTLETCNMDQDTSYNLEKINNAGTTILSTVNDILDISKIEAGKFELIPVEYDMPSLINDAITQCIMRIESKPIEFILNISENLPTRLYGDDLRIKQIMNNLLSNSFKYTKKGTVELSISCEKAENFSVENDDIRMTIKISDSGIGIKEEDIKKLFTDYIKMDSVSHRHIEGTGLGLSITKKLVEMMSGFIAVSSEYGKGSVFTVTVMQKSITDAVIGKEVVESLKNFHYMDHRRRENSRMERISLPYARVLVVDDVTTNLDVARGMLKPYGLQVDCLKSGKEAVDVIRSGKVKYDAIFMDHMMPEMDGIEAVKIIRKEIATEYAKTVPIIALTANAIIGNEEMFLSKGFQAFLPKPIDITRLDAIIREFVRDKNKEVEYTKEAEPERNAEKYSRNAGAVEVSGLDFAKGLTRFGNDRDAYLKVLRSFAANIPPLLDSVRGDVTADNIEKYTITVHGIKGASRGVGAEAIGNMAEALEHAAKAKDYEFIKKDNNEFISIVEELVEGLNLMLSKKDEENPKPKKDKPDRKTLAKLLDACLQYNMDGADAAIAELENYEYESEGELVEWLKDNVNKLNFIEIEDKLSTLDK